MSTFTHALSTNNYGPCKFIVDASAANGTHTTIAAAITSASSGDTIFIRPGTYTEDITLKAGISITSFDTEPYTPNVIILGKCTLTVAGSVSLSGIQLKTNGDFCVSVTGSAASILNLIDCYINCNNNTGIQYTTSSASSGINLYGCSGNLATTGIALYSHSSAGQILFNVPVCNNTGNSTTASSNSSGFVTIFGGAMPIPFSTSSTGAITLNNVFINTSTTNTTCLTTAGTGVSNIANSVLKSGTASTISIGAGTTVVFAEGEVASSNANAITGAGTLTASGIIFSSSSSTINTSTVSPLKTGPNLYVPGISFDGGSNILSTIPVPVASGGTGAATLTGILTGNGTSAVTANAVTQNGVLIGGASNAASSLAVAATGTVLAGATASSPSFTATPSVTSITLSSGSPLTTYTHTTWTPGVSFGGGTTGITYTTQSGIYIKIGQLVFCSYTIVLSNKGSSTGTARITGLPFTSLNSGSVPPSNSNYVASAVITFTVLYTDAYAQVDVNATTATLGQYGPTANGGTSSGLAALDDTNFANTTNLYGNIIYCANAE